MAKDLMAFNRSRCPKCRNEDPAKLFFSYHLSCPAEDKVCEGHGEEHLHLECRSCNYAGPMRTADQDSQPTPAVVTPVASRKK